MTVFKVISCSCHDMVNSHGFGRCEKKLINEHFDNQHVCYVNQPSNCSDLYTSQTNPGAKVSAKACETGTFKMNPYIFSCEYKTISG